jgi:hypothetical protein
LNQTKEYYNVSLKEKIIHQSWCFKNEIFIYFKTFNWNEGNIIISNKNTKTILPEIYKQIKLKQNEVDYNIIIFNLYSKFYYERNSKHLIK